MSQALGNLLPKLEALQRKALEGLEALRTQVDVRGGIFSLFDAGSCNGRPRFGVFPRDLLTVCLMLKEPALMREAIAFSAATIGCKRDPQTGEEPGRVLHEWNRVERNGYLSHYNAAETSHLLILAVEQYLQLSGSDRSVLREWADGLRQAGEYLLRHIDAGLFWEDPRHCRANRYMAYATYWKDSHLPGRRDLTYPVVYTLVQAQTVAAIRALIALESTFELGFCAERLERLASDMVRAIWEQLWDPQTDFPLIALDNGVRIPGISSDALHMLAYLWKGDSPTTKLEAIVKGAHQLETPYGYRTYAPGQPEYAPDSYHLGSIWPYEQFFIAKGALLHGLEEILDHSLGIIDGLELHGFHELLVWDGETLTAGGCDLQLWSAAYPQAIVDLLAGDLAR
jgi:glycogen debranching enzyme